MLKLSCLIRLSLGVLVYAYAYGVSADTDEVAVEAVTELDTVTVTADTEETDDNKLYNAKYSTGATRTDTPIKEIPQSVQIITRRVINDQQNVTVSETLRNVSGVIPNNVLFTPSTEATKIRGFAAEQLLDGFTQYYNPGDRESTNNLERVEVLKGSNAVLYSGGSGAPVGGVVNLVSKQPKPTAFGQIGTKIGSYDFYQPFVDINQPINDNVLTRFTAEYTNAGSFINEIDTERYNLNPSFTITDNNKNSFTLQSRIAKWRQQEYQGLPATGTVTGNFDIQNPYMFIGPSDTPYSHSDFYGVWASFDHWFNSTWSANVKARYSESEFDELTQTLVGRSNRVISYTADEPLRPNSLWGLTNTEIFQQQTEHSLLGNVLAQFDYGPSQNKFLLGADYSEFVDEGFNNLNSTLQAIDLAQAQPTFQPYIRDWDTDKTLFVTNTTYGGYAQLQSTLYQRLHLLFSVRAGVVEINYHDFNQLTYDGKTSATRILPRAGAVFDITPEFSLFVNYSEGMRGQPFTRFSGNPEPALSESLEAGFKFDFAQQLSGQIALYQIDRSNVAVAVNENAFSSKPGGQQQSKGFDVDLVYKPLPQLQLLGNYAYTIAEFSNDLAPGITKGNRLMGIPEHSMRVWANYEFSQPMLKGFSAGAGIYWQSEVYLSNRNLYQSDSYYTLDATLGYQYQRYKLAATIKNLSDEFYYQSYGYLGGRVAPAQGISTYVTFSMDF